MDASFTNVVQHRRSSQGPPAHPAQDFHLFVRVDLLFFLIDQRLLGIGYSLVALRWVTTIFCADGGRASSLTVGGLCFGCHVAAGTTSCRSVTAIYWARLLFYWYSLGQVAVEKVQC